MTRAARIQNGRLVATMLEGAWRAAPSASTCLPDELAAVVPLLLSFGAGALGWRRIRNTELKAFPDARELQQAYYLHTLQAALHEREIKSVIPFLNAAGIDPVMVKGWAIAQIYPEHGLRPYGDLDLCVRRSQYSAGKSALLDAEAPQCDVDLHDGFGKLDHLPDEELFERSILVDLGGVKVRVLSAEDHLRVLSVHMLRHGACRPLWLCDIAAALESLASDFDWDHCLTASRRVADWVICAIGLAHRLLGAQFGAKPGDIPVVGQAKQLPEWLIPAVLNQWGRAFRARAPIGGLWRRPLAAFRELPHHWPNGIEGTINVRGPFNELPRWPFQIGDSLRRSALFLAEIPKSLRRQR
jgi:hypothetical protein